jgi:very-short-patch-repair endonuclease
MQGRQPVSKETKRRMGLSKIGEKNPRYGKEPPNKGIKMSEEIRRKVRIARAKQIITDEHKEAIRRANSTEKNKEIHRRVAFKNLQNPIYSRTIPENLIEEELKKEKIEYVVQVPLPKERPISCVDFFLPKTNTVIYVDGNYWHTRPGQAARDKGINVILKNNGYKVLRFWESDIKKIEKRKQIIEQIKCIY